MPTYISLGIGDCEMCAAPGITVDVEEAAAGIARVEGKSWATITPAERDRYIELATGALEAIQ